MTQSIHLRCRRGEGYITLAILMLPLMFTVLSLALDGLSAIATYRRALALASIGAQAGAATVSFQGDVTTLVEDACDIATRAIRDNAPAANIVCFVTSDAVQVTVTLAPLRFFAGPFALNAERVSATIRGEPERGINFVE